MTATGSRSIAERYGTEGFGLAHLPYGSFSTGGGEPRLGVRIGDHVAAVADVLPSDAVLHPVVDTPGLTALLGADRLAWDQVRAWIEDVLSADPAPDLVEAALVPVEDVRLHLPFTVADYVDFYGNEHHATNLGRIFRPTQPPLLANWKHLPVGYHGRSGTIVVSGTDVRRPQGLRPEPDGVPSFGPSRRLDIELEMGFVLGSPVPGGHVRLGDAEDHVFGLVVTNDWSARDIQAYEYVPLGPNLGKSFATSVSAWVTPLVALDAARVAPPQRDVVPAAYLDDADAAPWAFDIACEIVLNGGVVSRPPLAATYWTAAQMLAHMTVNGAALRAGDFLAGGTVSGPHKGDRGCFLELTWDGAEPLTLADGDAFTYLRDGDEVVLRATARGTDGSVVRLGDCAGRIVPGGAGS